MDAYSYMVKLKDYASNELKNIARSAGVADSKIDGLDAGIKKANSSGSKMGQIFGGLKGLIAGVFATAAIIGFSNKVVEARSEYERYEAVLTNTFQSVERGESALNMLKVFAAETPFQLNELTDSFVKLVNRGFQPTKDELRSLGDLASSQGKSFNQLSEAILDAETAEFERLKEFGIKASKAGDQITLSFKGVSQTVDNNADAIRKAVLEYGNLNGVAGSMEAISKTLGGRISNLKDKWWNFLVAVGGQSDGVFNSFIDMASAGLDFLAAHLEEISMWFKILWTYIDPVIVSVRNFIKAAFGISDATTAMETFGNIMTGVLLVVDIFSTGLSYLLDFLAPVAPYIMEAVGAMWLLNIAMYANPVGIIVAGIVALIFAIGAAYKYTNLFTDVWSTGMKNNSLFITAFKDTVAANWSIITNSFMIGINKIKEGWYEFKNLLGLGESSENNKILDQIRQDTESRKKEMLNSTQLALNSVKELQEGFKIPTLEIDTEAIKKDFSDIKSKFQGLGEQKKINLFTPDTVDPNDPLGKKKKDKSKGDTIVSGGNKMTHITVHIGKLQDKVEIHVSNAKEGVRQLGEKVQEELLRSLNSVNQMQTN